MDREARAKVENLTSSYENRILVFVTLTAMIIFFAASIYIINFFNREAYDQAKGNKPLITYQVVYRGVQFTQVAAWVDKNGNSHYAKEPARFAGLDVSILVLALLGLGLARGSYGFYSLLTDRYKKRLMSESVYDNLRFCAQRKFYGKE